MQDNDYADQFDLKPGYPNFKMIAADPRNCNGAYVMLQTPSSEIVNLSPETVLDLLQWLTIAYRQGTRFVINSTENSY